MEDPWKLVAVQERAVLRLTDATERSGVVLNHLIDWHYVHVFAGLPVP